MKCAEFSRSDTGFSLFSLCGLPCAAKPAEDRFGLLSLRIEGRVGGEDRFSLVDFRDSSDKIFLSCEDDLVRVDSRWTLSPEGIIARLDTITAKKDIVLASAASRFVFAGGSFSLGFQNGRWCSESETHETALLAEIVLRDEGGRTCQGNAPYVILRDSDRRLSCAFHLIPRGDWSIHAGLTPSGGRLPYETVLELGTPDRDFALALRKGESFALPEILIQGLGCAGPLEAMPVFHRYLNRRFPPRLSSGMPEVLNSARHPFPIVYNTWFDAFDDLDPSRLERELDAAREVGCEVFTVDSGWYGMGNGSWEEKLGDFRERTDGAFRGRMKDFADRVRGAGLGFGLWVEPERLGKNAPVLAEHPGWFRRAANGFWYPALDLEEVRGYALNLVSHLIEDYGLSWIKVDFNMNLGTDPTGSGFARYYEGLEIITASLRKRYPAVFFEGCASGAMRMDISTLGGWDGHFLSDNVHPEDAKRIYEDTILRYLPGRITRWITVRPAGRSVPRYGTPLSGSPERVLVPGSATWEGACEFDLDRVFALGFPGIMGLSGDIAGLSHEQKRIVKRWVSFYSSIRYLIPSSVAYLLEGRGNPTAAVELLDEERAACVVSVCASAGSPSRFSVQPRGLRRDLRYRVREAFGDSYELSGEELMEKGLIFASPRTSMVACCEPAAETDR